MAGFSAAIRPITRDALTPVLNQTSNALGTIRTALKLGEHDSAVLTRPRQLFDAVEPFTRDLPDEHPLVGLAYRLQLAAEKNPVTPAYAHQITGADQMLDAVYAMRGEGRSTAGSIRSGASAGASQLHHESAHAFGDEHTLNSMGGVDRSAAHHAINGPDGQIQADGQSLDNGTWDIPGGFLG